MKHLAIAISLSILGALFVAAPAAAWHVDTVDCDTHAKGKILQPYGDPWGRIVVRNDLSCTGAVDVPDAGWLGNGVFTVAGKGGVGGTRIFLPAGCYDGTWSNSSEIESFCIEATPRPVTVGWSFFGRQGKTTRVITVPYGCVYRSGYQWMKGSSKTKIFDRTEGRLLRPMKNSKTKLRVSPPGYYKPLDRGYAKGLTC